MYYFIKVQQRVYWIEEMISVQFTLCFALMDYHDLNE